MNMQTKEENKRRAREQWLNNEGEKDSIKEPVVEDELDEVELEDVVFDVVVEEVR